MCKVKHWILQMLQASRPGCAFGYCKKRLTYFIVQEWSINPPMLYPNNVPQGSLYAIRKRVPVMATVSKLKEDWKVGTESTQVIYDYGDNVFFYTFRWLAAVCHMVNVEMEEEYSCTHSDRAAGRTNQKHFLWVGCSSCGNSHIAHFVCPSSSTSLLCPSSWRFRHYWPSTLRPRLLSISHYQILAGNPNKWFMYDTLRCQLYCPQKLNDVCMAGGYCPRKRQKARQP